MLCPKCGKESQNQRVCGHCQTPYPTGMTGKRDKSGRRLSGGGAAAEMMASIGSVSPAVRWGAIAVVAGSLAVYFLMLGGERKVPVGEAMPNIIAAAMSPGEAQALLATVAKAATVEVRGSELFVKVTANYPQQRAGLMAYAQQYARADEVVNGKRRVINFMDPEGTQFAKADPTVGVTLVK